MLRNLNKDMLIQLVETIGRDKQKRIDELENLLEKYKSVVTTKKCNTEGCKAMTIEGERSLILVGPEMYRCDNCVEYTCENHGRVGMRFRYCTECS
jgi:hypothetical protein